MKKFSLSTWLYFMIPSILGIILFMIPLKFGDEWKVPIAKLADILSAALEPAMPMAAMIVIIIAALGSVLFLFVKTEAFETIIYHKFIQSITVLDNHPRYRGYFRCHGDIPNRT